MKVRVSSVLVMPQQAAWELLNQAPTLIYVSKSWVRLVGLEDSLDLYEGQKIHAIVQPSRRIESGHYWITVHTVDAKHCLIRTSESGLLYPSTPKDQALYQLLGVEFNVKSSNTSCSFSFSRQRRVYVVDVISVV